MHGRTPGRPSARPGGHPHAREAIRTPGRPSAPSLTRAHAGGQSRRGAAGRLAAKGAVRLIVDLGGVDFLDSTGLGALVGGLRRLREAGGSLALAISTPRILRIFQITGLTQALAAQHSVTDAITADPHWQQTAESQAGGIHQWCQQHGLS